MKPFKPMDNGSNMAIIDIGSNTVRLVVFHGPARVPLPLFNEKAQCRLGRGLDKTGCLNPDGVTFALETITRFMKLLEVMKVTQVSLLATAAVREAKDGPDFVATIKERFDVDVDVLSGEEEAKLAAYGLLSGLPHADGLLGDMGGSSFDLVGLDNGQFSTHETTPLGHLRLNDAHGDDVQGIRKTTRKILSAMPWLKDFEERPFYGVGGSIRSVARVILHMTDYPIHIIDNFTLERKEAVPLLERFCAMSPEDLQQVPDISKKRIDTLHSAFVLLIEIMSIVKPSHLVFSGYSMREGQFFQSLSPFYQAKDPLISSCIDLIEREGRFGLQGEEVFTWMNPLFEDEDPRYRTLRHAACLLHDISWAEHPDYRADHGFLRTLRLPVAGLSHHDRALMGACIYNRYKGNFDKRIARPLHYFLNEADTVWTKTVGCALRLAQTLADGAPHLLEETALEIRGDDLILRLPEQGDIFTGEALGKRLGGVAKQLELSCRLEYG